MCKLYIETSDLDNSITAVLEDLQTGAKSSAIDGLHSNELQNVSHYVAHAANHTEPVTQASHTLKLGILIGLKLAESQLSLLTGSGTSISNSTSPKWKWWSIPTKNRSFAVRSSWPSRS